MRKSVLKPFYFEVEAHREKMYCGFSRNLEPYIIYQWMLMNGSALASWLTEVGSVIGRILELLFEGKKKKDESKKFHIKVILKGLQLLPICSNVRRWLFGINAKGWGESVYRQLTEPFVISVTKMNLSGECWLSVVAISDIFFQWLWEEAMQTFITHTSNHGKTVVILAAI